MGWDVMDYGDGDGDGDGKGDEQMVGALRQGGNGMDMLMGKEKGISRWTM